MAVVWGTRLLRAKKVKVASPNCPIVPSPDTLTNGAATDKKSKKETIANSLEKTSLQPTCRYLSSITVTTRRAIATLTSPVFTNITAKDDILLQLLYVYFIS